MGGIGGTGGRESHFLILAELEMCWDGFLHHKALLIGLCWTWAEMQLPWALGFVVPGPGVGGRSKGPPNPVV